MLGAVADSVREVSLVTAALAGVFEDGMGVARLAAKQSGDTAEDFVNDRILQVFHTLKKNLSTVNFRLLLTDVMTIAGECDSHLEQTIGSSMGKAAQVAA
jgi:hypothetical protein